MMEFCAFAALWPALLGCSTTIKTQRHRCCTGTWLETVKIAINANNVSKVLLQSPIEEGSSGSMQPHFTAADHLQAQLMIFTSDFLPMAALACLIY